MTDTPLQSVGRLNVNTSPLVNTASWANHHVEAPAQWPITNINILLPNTCSVPDSIQRWQEASRSRIGPTLRAHDIACSYGGSETPAVLIDYLAFPKGSKTVLLGPCGAGKTTLLKLLAGSHSPCEGVVEINGIPLKFFKRLGLRTGIGYIPQEVRLYRGTLRENLLPSGVLPTDDALREALDFAECGDLLTEHPDGLDQLVGDGGRQLSAGQAQLIHLARLWLQDPKIVVLDAPFSAVEASLVTKLLKKLSDWCRFKTLILATEQPRFLCLVKTAMVLSKGRLVAKGDVDLVTATLSPSQLRCSHD